MSSRMTAATTAPPRDCPRSTLPEMAWYSCRQKASVTKAVRTTTTAKPTHHSVLLTAPGCQVEPRQRSGADYGHSP